MTEPRRMSVEEYLAYEEASPYRHEYFDGMAHPMGDIVPVKKSAYHSLIIGNALLALHDRVPRCQLLLTGSAILRTEVPGTDIHRFPDVLVMKYDHPDEAAVCNEPLFAAEILLPEPEQYGSLGAEEVYRQFDSLSEFILIPDRTFAVEIFRRSKQWRKEVFALGDNFTLDTFAVTITVDHIFRNIKWS
jgi:hypothetical protein